MSFERPIPPIMPVSLSIKAVFDTLAERLRRRVAGKHRWLQREWMALGEAAVPFPLGLTTDIGGATTAVDAGHISVKEGSARRSRGQL